VWAASDATSPDAAAALEKLCTIYWRPVFTYIRRRGYPLHEAQDLTQEFFARLLERNYLGHLQHQDGRFRSFLLTFVNHTLSAEREKSHAAKRGGGRIPISLDALEEVEGGARVPADTRTPEEIFDQTWANTLLRRAEERIRSEYESIGKRDLFEVMWAFQPSGRTEEGYDEIARRFGSTASALKSAVHRMRRRHGAILREEVANTVSSPDQIDAEIRFLIQAVSQ
jgi:RNA polymerase sigma-70 factor (ECF subfamily)